MLNSSHLLSWTLRTEDTLVVLAVSNDRPAIMGLKHPLHDWNWTAVPSEFPLMERIEIADRQHLLHWVYQDAQADTTVDGDLVALRFTNASPALELKSIWRARRGPGPVEHWITIQNKTGERIFIQKQESLDIRIRVDQTCEPKVWYVNKDGGSPFSTHYQVSGFGVYSDALVDRYAKEIWTRVDTGLNDTGFIPWTAVDAGGKYGMYAGWASENGRVQVEVSGSAPLTAVIKAGLYAGFVTRLEDQEVFDTPAAFIGTYIGDVDDGSNRMRRWIFATRMPEINRSNENIPHVAWNAFWNTAIEPKSWLSEERNYYHMVDGLAEVGVEEVVLDVGWWQAVGDWRPHAERWSSGLAQAASYAHAKGMRFGLYFWFRNGQSLHPQALSSRGPNAHPGWFVGGDRETAPADLSVPECREWICKRLETLFDEYGVDTFRTDFTPLTAAKAPDSPHGGINDAEYWSERGFLDLLDFFYASKPGFKYQNCSGGGAMKAFGVMGRSSVIQTTDVYNAIDTRKAIYDSLFCYPAVQLMTMFGDHVSDGKLGTSSYRFRSYLYAAPCAHIEHPGEMSQEDRMYLAGLIASFKRDIRPLLRCGDVYHILPRPDGVHWDGIEYYDPGTRKGVAMLFKPDCGEDTQTIRLRGLDRELIYQVHFEDGTNPPVNMRGADLIERGLPVRLMGKYVAEWMFFQAAA